MALFRSSLDAMIDTKDGSRAGAPPVSGIAVSDDEQKFLMMAASASYAEGEYERAKSIYHSMEIILPEWAQPTLGRGMCLYALGSVDEAEETYRAALTKDESCVEALVYLGELLWHQRHRGEEAAQLLFQAQRINAHDPVVLRAKALLHEIKKTAET